MNKWANELSRNFSKEESINDQSIHEKKMFHILAMKEMIIKMSLRFFLIPGRMAIIKKTNNIKSRQGCRSQGKNPHTLSVGV
jgi:hypothetical protein